MQICHSCLYKWLQYTVMYITETRLVCAMAKSFLLNGLRCSRRPELVREFIHDCLYNEREGYFQRHVNIFTTRHSPLDFPSLRDQDDYSRQLYSLYAAQSQGQKFYQLWHTPSELFRPWYGRGIADYLSRMAQAHLREDEPIVIYEVGPGNGALCADICSHFREKYPAFYRRLEYNLVEISQHLIKTQLEPLQREESRIKIHSRSFLEWSRQENRKVFVLAIEMFDNLPQDRIKFDIDGSLLQGMVVTNDDARYSEDQPRYSETFVPVEDALILDLVNVMDRIGYRWPSLRGTLLDSLQSIWPLTAFQYDKPWRKEFIPTGPFQFLKTLYKHFPRHALLMTDFDWLPETIEGYGAPVVQTRYEGDTVACSTYLLQRGLFDIFFPINFHLLCKIISLLGAKHTEVLKHEAFCRSFMDLSRTRTRSGYNPMVEDFENVSFLTSSTLTK